MSHQELLIAVDFAALTELVRLHRRAGATGALGELIEAVARVQFPKRSAARTLGAKMLAKYEALGMPEQLIEHARLEADPQATWLAALRAGELLDEGDLRPLFQRVSKDVHGTLWWAAWCLDPLRRRVAAEADEYPFVCSTGESSPACDGHLFGSAALTVDDVPVEAYRTALRGVSGLIAPGQTRAAGAFFDGITAHEPPTLAEFSRWYRQLHARDFTISPDLRPPQGTHLTWAHARFLAEVRAFCGSVGKFYASATTQGHAVIACIE